ncbi:MAG TPA: PolC-type DNA polymerase III, partial [Lachnospiraceae bacterium]|nr:PolC-type DNA polymerase III [Lachnospiraceae bacterium]
MDRKKFYEVFPDIVLEDEYSDIFNHVDVVKILKRENNSELVVCIEADRLIDKMSIYRAEEVLREHLFGSKSRIRVRLAERYLLSNQYNLKNLVDVYYDSFLLEIGKKSSFDQQQLRKKDYEVSGNDLVFNITDSFVMRGRVDNLKEYFERTLLERFGMNVNVSFSFKESESEAGGAGKKKGVEKEEDEGGFIIGPEMADYAFVVGSDIDLPFKAGNSYEKVSGSVINSADNTNNTDNPSAQSDAAMDAYYEGMMNDELMMNEYPGGGQMESAPVHHEENAADNQQSSNRNEKADEKADDKKEKKKPGTGREYAGSRRGGNTRRSNDPDCFYGRNCEGDITEIKNLEDNMGEVCIRGQILGIEERELRTGKILITATITDFTDTIGFKLFIQPDDLDVIREELKQGNFYKLKGVPAYDPYAREVNITSVTGVKKSADWRESRNDDEEEKRIELNMHTLMSEMDSVVDIKKMIKRAKAWGHKAVAITDNGVVQAFPIANHEVSPDEDFKIIYGVTAYLANDMKTLVLNGHDEDFDKDDTEFVVFDIETTGLSVKHCKIIEIGAVRIDKNGKELGRFSEFVNPEVPIPYNIEKLTSITDLMVADAPTIEVILPRFLEFSKGAVLVAHNAEFDTGFIREFSMRLGYEYDFTALDTMTLAQVFIPDIGRYNLDRLCKYFNVVNKHHHRACDDADVTGKIFVKLMELIKNKGISSVKALNEYGSVSADKIRKGRVYDATILVKNDPGRVNLYRLISDSHIKYFNTKPRMPMSLVNEFRDGLIVGSGTSGSELYEYLLNGASDEDIEKLVNFFDYLEVQPPSNDEYMIRNDRSRVTCREDLEDIIRKIVELGAKYDKPVVATGNVHFLDPEDAIYREIVLEGSMNKGSMKKALKEAMENGESLDIEQPPLYFRTTREMLDEFSFLGYTKAKEIVIDNPNKINDMIEKISPVRPDKAPPVIENSDKTLREICYNKAHEIYGPNLPEIVETRLEKELNSIIGNGYSVMYIIAQKLVWKSNDDGYLVGSRGSVGSSFAATMAGITEVNPLSPHYICPNCFYTDFDSELVKSYSGMSGCDMPDCDCPKCGTKMRKEGHDIPFETFLGFKGDKEPDIDLNFSGDYQPKAHA